VLGVSDAVVADLLAGGVPRRLLRTHYMGLFAGKTPDASERHRLREVLSIPEDAVVFGNIAFDAPFKGVDVLVDAFSRLSSRNKQVHLVQLGVDPEHSVLSQRLMGGTERIHWLGIRDDAADYLPAVDIYVQPSRYGEGLPLAIMEAMSLGIPVIATSVAGNSEAVLDGVSGRLVPPNDPVALAGAMEEMAENASPTSGSAPHALGKNGRVRYESLFNGEVSVSRLLDLYGC
jgi:glycosyltransferase involved in cell wall biosynthesis